MTELAENDLPGVPSAVFAFKEVSLYRVARFGHYQSTMKAKAMTRIVR